MHGLHNSDPALDIGESCGSTFDESEDSVRQMNAELAALNPEQRIAWAFQNLPETHVLSSSFGVQAALCLHLVTRVFPDTPVVFVDTGYHFPETYRFVDLLTTKLDLQLHVYRSRISPAWQESRFGQRWLQGVEGIEAYNQENKVDPMRGALAEQGAGTWITGIRRDQTRSRAQVPFLTRRFGVWKLAPVADWSDGEVHRYLTRHRLPYHPLREKGYVSIGDVHSTRSLAEVDSIEQTRFFGLKRECGLHDADE